MNKELELFKAHDFCKSNEPKLTVVMIHGIASDSSTYTDALKYLESKDELKDVRFITFDLLGVGNSFASDELNYDYSEQLSALDNSIKKLNIDTPLVMVGHSMGTMILARYLKEYQPSIKKLVLLSSPIYREEDLKNPVFVQGMDAFKKGLSDRLTSASAIRQFEHSVDNIVLNPGNFEYYAYLSVPTVCIYGIKDKLIIPQIIEGIAAKNPNVTAICGPDGHSLSEFKAEELFKVLESEVNETI